MVALVVALPALLEPGVNFSGVKQPDALIGLAQGLHDGRNLLDIHKDVVAEEFNALLVSGVTPAPDVSQGAVMLTAVALVLRDRCERLPGGRFCSVSESRVTSRVFSRSRFTTRRHRSCQQRIIAALPALQVIGKHDVIPGQVSAQGKGSFGAFAARPGRYCQLPGRPWPAVPVPAETPAPKAR